MKEEKEKEREKLRQAHVREWDVGKEGVAEKKKEKFREMSQEEYVEQQRCKRIEEFAPPQVEEPFSTATHNSEKYFNDKGLLVESESSQSRAKTWSDVRPQVNTVISIPSEEESPQKGLYFTSNKKAVKYKNFVQGSTMIVNELNDEDSNQHKKSTKRKEITHAEIPPPPTFEYYGPSVKQYRTDIPFTSDLQEAYDQGMQQLEKKKGKANISEQYNFIL